MCLAIYIVYVVFPHPIFNKTMKSKFASYSCVQTVHFSLRGEGGRLRGVYFFNF